MPDDGKPLRPTRKRFINYTGVAVHLRHQLANGRELDAEQEVMDLFDQEARSSSELACSATLNDEGRPVPKLKP